MARHCSEQVETGEMENLALVIAEAARKSDAAHWPEAAAIAVLAAGYSKGRADMTRQKRQA